MEKFQLQRLGYKAVVVQLLVRRRSVIVLNAVGSQGVKSETVGLLSGRSWLTSFPALSSSSPYEESGPGERGP